MHSGYKAVIGLEIHAQLLTRSKMFCKDPAMFGGDPNTYVSPISLGHPGTLPRVNEKAIEFAIRMGLATNCNIREYNLFARKNYFYADLPKGYQISQHNTPICHDGFVEIPLRSGETKRIRIMRIHIEEDSGKSLHDQDVYNSLIDLNRAGTPLIEIVTEADLTSPEEASAYVTEIRKLVRYLGICDGNMEEGSLRCDANISVMKVDAKEWGTKVEVKNMNSITNIARAIQFEIDRQIAANESGERIIQQTRTWDALNNRTLVMREKESSDDYRYFPEPDLQPMMVTADILENVKTGLPELPTQRYARYVASLGMSHDDAFTILEQKEFSDWFDGLLKEGMDAKDAIKWGLGPVRAWLNESASHISEFPLTVSGIRQIAELVNEGKVSFSIAKDQLFNICLKEPGKSPEELAKSNNLILETDTSEIEFFMKKLMAENPEKVEAFRSGKTGLLGFFVGQVMQATKGKADPKEVNRIVNSMLT